MSWLVDPKIGDRFRWRQTGVICKIITIKDNGVQLNFVYETGPNKGQWGYTLQPQEIEALTVLDELALIE